MILMRFHAIWRRTLCGAVVMLCLAAGSPPSAYAQDIAALIGRDG